MSLATWEWEFWIIHFVSSIVPNILSCKLKRSLDDNFNGADSRRFAKRPYLFQLSNVCIFMKYREVATVLTFTVWEKNIF